MLSQNKDILIEICKYIPLNEIQKMMIQNKKIYGILDENIIIWEDKYNILIKNNGILSIDKNDNYKESCKKYKCVSRLKKWTLNKYNINKLVNMQDLDLWNNQIT